MAVRTHADMMLYSATKLTMYTGGRITGSGTGFFYQIPADEGKVFPLLITNKHVVDGQTAVEITFHVSKPGPTLEPSGEVVNVSVGVVPGLAIPHPRADVDLCAVNIGGVLERAQQRGVRYFFTCLSRTMLPSPEDWETFDSIEELTMVGCPSGIHDAANNIPIIRRGISATPMTKRFNGKPEFMVDMACFPGSSGSPIFVHNRDGYLDRSTNRFVPGKQRLFLVGILYGGPMHKSDGGISIGEGTRIPFEVATTMHLGLAINAAEILELEKHWLEPRQAEIEPPPPSDPELPRWLR